MDVQVYRLTAPLDLPDFKPYGRPARATVLPAGTYWIPMAQAQKHWIQSMLNENTYVPFPYFYDVSGWSNPLLFNVSGGRSGAVLTRRQPSSWRRSLLPAHHRCRFDVPRVGVYQISSGTSARESTGWLRYLLEQVWQLPYNPVTSAQIAAGALTDVDVLLVPNGVSTVASNALGPAGRKALVAWVNAGGEYIGWRGGVDLAARLGLTTARIAEPHSDIAGTLIRVAVDPASPLAAGVGEFNWVFYDYDIVMTASSPAHVAARFPAHGGPDFFVSGFARGESELGGTAAVIDEPVGTGRVVSFSTDPNYRAWTVGMQKMLRNAVLGDAASAAVAAPRAGSQTRAAAERASKDAAAKVAALESPLRLSVNPPKRRRRARRPRPPRRELHAAPLGKQSNVPDRQPHRTDRRRPSVRSDATRRSTRRRRSRPRISSTVAKPARGPVHMPDQAVASSALRARRPSTTRRSE